MLKNAKANPHPMDQDHGVKTKSNRFLFSFSGWVSKEQMGAFLVPSTEQNMPHF